ncbi:hypothetical protein ES703_45736 [subsurface metagenome]
MPTKDFERVIRFYEHQIPNGDLIYLPLVGVTLITQTNNRISLSLLFDTGASVTTLRSDLYPFLELQSWNQGHRVDTQTASGVTDAYQYTRTLEIFGKIISCPINLMQMPPNPLFHGLLGRDTVFNEFGFGFWENTRELYVTTSP